MNIYHLILMVVCLFDTGTGKISMSTQQPSPTWHNVDYVGDASVGHQMSIYLPDTGRGSYPVVLLIYGSAWFGNNLKDTAFRIMGYPLLKSGFAVVTVNHRSSREAKFPAQINDVKAAVRYIRANAKKYRFDTSFIGATGYSSGGHLSSLLGTSGGVDNYALQNISVLLEGSIGESAKISSNVNAVVDWYGPTDFTIMDSCGSEFSHNAPGSPESWLIGGPVQHNRARCALANPITYIDSTDPPFLILHGDADLTVPVCQSEKFFKELQRKKVRSRLIVVPKAGHGPGLLEPKYFSEMVQFFITERRSTKR